MASTLRGGLGKYSNQWEHQFAGRRGECVE